MFKMKLSVITTLLAAFCAALTALPARAAVALSARVPSLEAVHRGFTAVTAFAFSPVGRVAFIGGALVIAAWLHPSSAFAAPFVIGAVLTEGKHTAEFIVSECNGALSRDLVTVTVPAETTFKPGSVLGKVTATGKYGLYDNADATGVEVAAAVLYDEQVNDTGAPVDVKAVVINFGAEVRKADLVWEAGQDAAAQAAGLVDLAARFVKAR